MGNPQDTPRIEKFVDPIRGFILTPEREEKVIMDILLPRKMRESPALYRTKWFDYRRLSPVHATYLFALYYTKAYRRMMVRRVGIEQGQYARGFSGDDVFANPRAMAGMWRARQTADKMGIPYPFYNNFAIRWGNDRLWKNLPQPVHLYGAQLLEDLAKAWEEQLKASIEMPEDNWYSARSFQEAPEQIAFQLWLCEQIDRRPARLQALGFSIVASEMLVESFAVSHFGQDTVTKAISLWG